MRFAQRSGYNFGVLNYIWLALVLLAVAIGDFSAASAGFKHFTGYEGIFCGFSAIYAGLAQVLNELFGKTVLPLGPVKK